MALSTFTLLGNHHHCPSSELLSSFKIETLYLLNYSLFPLFPGPGSHHSTFFFFF